MNFALSLIVLPTFLINENNALRQISREIPIEQPGIMDMCSELAEGLLEVAYRGAGTPIAAPQVGILLRMIVVHSYRYNYGPLALINPVLEPLGPKMETNWEACLSIPEVHGLVPRFKRVRVKAYDLRGNQLYLEEEGYKARVLQHEIDHLDGILYPDRMVDSNLVPRKTVTAYLAQNTIQLLKNGSGLTGNK